MRVTAHLSRASTLQSMKRYSSAISRPTNCCKGSNQSESAR